MSELQKDMSLIRTGLKDIQKELDFQRSRPADASDLFVPTMKEFAAKATYKCRQLEDEFSDMRARVSHGAGVAVSQGWRYRQGQSAGWWYHRVGAPG